MLAPYTNLIVIKSIKQVYMGKKKKLHVVKYNKNKYIMPGADISILQQSGCSVKRIRIATEEDLNSIPHWQ